MPTNLNDPILSAGTVNMKEASRWTSLCRTTLLKLMKAGDLAYVKIGKRRLIPRAALEELVRKNLVNV